jgi:hypothetical protein
MHGGVLYPKRLEKLHCQEIINSIVEKHCQESLSILIFYSLPTAIVDIFKYLATNRENCPGFVSTLIFYPWW